MWGAWLEVDGAKVGNLAPLCHRHHRELHDIGARSFDRFHGVSVARAAREAGERFLAGEDPCAIPW